MSIYAPVYAVDMVSPDAADMYLSIAAFEIAASERLTEAQHRDLCYRMAWASEHGTPCVLTPREVFALLGERGRTVEWLRDQSESAHNDGDDAQSVALHVAAEVIARGGPERAS